MDGSRNRPFWAMATAMLIVANACRDPQSPKQSAQLLLTDGATLAAQMHTSGTTDIGSVSALDPDGYVVWVDATQSQTVGANGTAAFSGLASGDHAVAAYGIASNCIVSTLNHGPNNPRTVSIVAGMGGVTDFDIGCGAWGQLFVSVRTTGVDLDADGYTVTVDGTQSQVASANGSVTFTQLYAAGHSIALSGAASNCSVTAANPATVTVAAGKMTSLTFTASCAPIGTGTGSLTVTTSTMGSDVDLDGYIVTIDGTITQTLSPNDTITITAPAGEHPVVLSGVASNCDVNGTTPQTVTVAAGGTGTTAFAVTCGVPQARVSGTGQIGMGSPGTADNVQVFAFDVRADGTGRFSYTDYGDLHPNGNPASVIADASTVIGTGITAYRNSSAACTDPSRGVEFDAIGRDDQDESVVLTVIVCDAGPQGTGADLFSLYAPSKAYGRSGIVISGDMIKQ